MAASATFALKAGVWFRRGRLFIVSPDSLAQRARCQAETPLIVLFRFLRPALQVGGSKARGIAEPQVSVVEDVEHQPRLGAERPAPAILRHILFCPRHPATALAR